MLSFAEDSQELPLNLCLFIIFFFQNPGIVFPNWDFTSNTAKCHNVFVELLKNTFTFYFQTCTWLLRREFLVYLLTPMPELCASSNTNTN